MRGSRAASPQVIVAGEELEDVVEGLEGELVVSPLVELVVSPLVFVVEDAVLLSDPLVLEAVFVTEPAADEAVSVTEPVAEEASGSSVGRGVVAVLTAEVTVVTWVRSSTV